MRSAFSLMTKLCIFQLLIATIISSNFFVHSQEFPIFCTHLRHSLDEAMGDRILTLLPSSIKVFVASSEEFAGKMHQKMGKFARELATFVDASEEHKDLFPENAFKHIINAEAISAFVNKFTSSTRGTTAAKELETVLKFGENVEPKHLENIFTILDNLIVNIKPVVIANEQGLSEVRYKIIPADSGETEANAEPLPSPFPLAPYIASFLEKVKKFVHHLKRELIYAQSEATISNMATEFHEFTEIELIPMKKEATKYAKNELKSLKKKVATYGKEVAEFQSKNRGSMQPAIIATRLYDEDYQHKLEKGRMGESSSMGSTAGRFVGKWSSKASSMMEKVSLKEKKGKGPEHSALLSTAEQHGKDISIKEDLQANFFDQLEAKYIVKSKKDQNFLVEYHEYRYLYGLLKSSSNEINEKIQALVSRVLENGKPMGPAVAKKFEDDKKVVYVLAENIVKPLLNVIDGQMRQEYGPRIVEKHAAEYKTIEKYFMKKSTIPIGSKENWVISKEMINAEMAMYASNGNKTKAARQFRIRVNALKLLAIYERLQFFFKVFENEKNMAAEDQQKMTNEWLHGNLDEQKEEFILPERFGQLIFDETKKRMEEGKA